MEQKKDSADERNFSIGWKEKMWLRLERQKRQKKKKERKQGRMTQRLKRAKKENE